MRRNWTRSPARQKEQAHKRILPHALEEGKENRQAEGREGETHMTGWGGYKLVAMFTEVYTTTVRGKQEDTTKP
jgi:hypothetical protein